MDDRIVFGFFFFWLWRLLEESKLVIGKFGKIYKKYSGKRIRLYHILVN